ncbi:enterochelin esterase-like enzyme [Dyadobacter arcticus]|uniref:Enterochelin esterase-like enzyme n=1 Tax=Dyadobacter arcticus TaxID=1078754 RepID=A0ABX0UMP3_9BACT|nr:enterochelin esterase-like enzyme [Dyadobacter arcticus]
MPKGFDSVREGIAAGKIDSIQYRAARRNMGATGGIAGFNENALKMFENELKLGAIPFVESSYRVETTSAGRALAGLSMGGLQTLYAGVKNNDMFSYLGVFSSGWFANNTTPPAPHYEKIDKYYL